jgi:hypothetical protein
LPVAAAPFIWLAADQALWQRWGVLFWPPDWGLPSMSSDAMSWANRRVTQWPGFPAAAACQRTFDAAETGDANAAPMRAYLRQCDPDNDVVVALATAEWLGRLVPGESLLAPAEAAAAYRALQAELDDLGPTLRIDLHLEDRWQTRYESALREGALPMDAVRFAEVGRYTSYVPVLRDWARRLGRLGRSLSSAGEAESAARCHQAVARLAVALAESTEQPPAILLACDLLAGAADELAGLHDDQGERERADAWRRLGQQASDLRGRLRDSLQGMATDPLRYDGQPTTRPELLEGIFVGIAQTLAAWLAATCGLLATLIVFVVGAIARGRTRSARPRRRLAPRLALAAAGVLPLVVVLVATAVGLRPATRGELYNLAFWVGPAVPLLVAVVIVLGILIGPGGSARWRRGLILAMGCWLVSAWLALALSWHFSGRVRAYESQIAADRVQETTVRVGPGWRSAFGPLPEAQWPAGEDRVQ